MKIRLFGKDLFEFNKKGDMAYYDIAMSPKSAPMQSKFLPDFYTMRDYNNWGSPVIQFIDSTLSTNTLTTYTGSATGGVTAAPKALPKSEKPTLTPKRVFDLKMLHDKDFKLATDPAYVDEQLGIFKEKLNLIKSEEYDISRGVNDIASIVMRLENRKKYETQKAFFEQFPYTTTSRVDSVVKKHSYLKLGQVAQFVADMPKEAVQTMKDYNKATAAICGKQAVYYIIADQKDFQRTVQRRDPILLAQSPFGHVWQILGAWDKEMIFLEEL